MTSPGTEPPSYAEAAAALAAQPFSALLGLELIAFTMGDAELVLPVRPQLHQQHGLVHGGVLAALADNAIAFAGGSVLGPDVVTAAFQIDYLRPAVGERLHAAAHVVGSSGRSAWCRCDIYAKTARAPAVHCATAHGTVSRRGRGG